MEKWDTLDRHMMAKLQHLIERAKAKISPKAPHCQIMGGNHLNQEFEISIIKGTPIHLNIGARFAFNVDSEKYFQISVAFERKIIKTKKIMVDYSYSDSFESVMESINKAFLDADNYISDDIFY